MGLPDIPSLVKRLNIKSWDVLLIGDGSGGHWELGHGSATVLIDRWSNARKLFVSAMAPGTVSLGEIFPYLHAMCWYTSKDGPGKRTRERAAGQGRAVDIHVVTDSEYVASCGSNPGSRKAYKELWSAFDAFANSGYQLHYHFVGRSQVDMNCLVDELARQARKSLQLDAIWNKTVPVLQKRYPGLPADFSIYDFSPNAT